jgi:hypothetical protein
VRFDQWISSASPKWQRLAVVQLTRYLSLETGYRQDMDEAVSTWNDLKLQVFSMTEDIFEEDGTKRHALIGMVTFITEKPEDVILYHAYLHPFFRKKGLLTTNWKQIKMAYPVFNVEHPISPAFQAFLEKHNK